MNTRKAEYIRLLTTLSDLCHQHKDELIARTEYYKAVHEDYQRSQKNPQEYFSENPLELDPVPSILLPTLAQLKKQDIPSDEQDFININQIIPNISFLHKNLTFYNKMVGDLDQHYHFFDPIGHDVLNIWENANKENLLSHQIPDLISENEIAFDLNKHITFIALQMDNLSIKKDKDEKTATLLSRSGITRETKVRAYIKDELRLMKNELDDYRKGLEKEIMDDIKDNKTFYCQYFNNEDPTSKEFDQIMAVLLKNYKSLMEHQEGILPRATMESSYIINQAIAKYICISNILFTLNNSKDSQQTVVDNSIKAIKDALPYLETSRDSRIKNMLKHFLCLFTLGAAAFFLFETTSNTLVSKHLAKLSLFRYKEENPPRSELDSLNYRLN